MVPRVGRDLVLQNRQETARSNIAGRDLDAGERDAGAVDRGLEAEARCVDDRDRRRLDGAARQCFVPAPEILAPMLGKKQVRPRDCLADIRLVPYLPVRGAPQKCDVFIEEPLGNDTAPLS